MTWFVLGLVLFFGVHLVPLSPFKDSLRVRMGVGPYRGLFSVVSLLGIVLIVIGYGQVPVEYLFAPQSWGRPALLMVMPFVFILFAAANMPTHIRKVLRHPMMIGTLIWSSLHFFANGERAASYLFGAFVLYALISILVRVVQPSAPANAEGKPIAWKFDLMAIAGGIIVYAVFLHAHGWLFGPALLTRS